MILEKSLGSCFENVKSSLSEVLDNIEDMDNRIDETCWDHDIAGFVWNEFPNHYASSSSTSKEKTKGNNMLSMQVKGCTPSVKRYVY